MTNFNSSQTALPAAVYTTSRDLDLHNGEGHTVVVLVNVEAVGTGTLTVTIRGKARDPATNGSPIYYNILATTAIATAVPARLTVGPGLPVTANVSANDVVPESWNIQVAKSDNSAWTFSVSYFLAC